MDINQLSLDGTSSLGTRAFSESGAFYAHGIQRSGSDWQTVHVKEVSSGENLPDKLEWVKFSSIAWTHDEKGFFYARYPPPPKGTKEEKGEKEQQQEDEEEEAAGSEVDSNLNQKVYYHTLGTRQEDDPMIFHTPEDPTLLFGVEVTDDGKYLLITQYKGTAPVNKLYYYDLSAGFDPSAVDAGSGLPLVKLIDDWEAQYEYIANDETRFWFKTNHKAPRNKIIILDLLHPNESEWQEAVPEEEDVLDFAVCFDQDKLALAYLRHVQSVLTVHRLHDGQRLFELPLPAPGTVQEISGRRHESYLFFTFTSFLYPRIIFHYDRTKSPEPTVFHETKVPGFDPSGFVTEQVFYASKDGTRVPMFVVSKKGLPRDGSGAVWLYGYGGFNISVQPSFSSFRVVLMQNLGVTLAIPNIRGGGEYGEEWHKAGILEKKQNVFDDFIAAAEWLVEHKYTSPARLAIAGGSNGGLLVGACLNQRPELFGCAVSMVGVLDMLRYHKFTVGHAWVPEYGCADNPSHFAFLRAYSPLHNIRSGVPYPAVLLTTGDHDDRVVPLHSHKFIATLQHVVGSCEQQQQPLIIRVETKAGHGAGKPTAKVIEETADIYSFISYVLGLQWTD